MAQDTNSDPIIDINGAGPTPTPKMTPMPTNRTVPSLIPIPNQIAVTVCWVGLGIAIGYYICHKSNSPRRRSDIG